MGFPVPFCSNYKLILIYTEKEKGVFSPRENYFSCAGQNVRQAFNALPDILIRVLDIFLSS